MNNLLSAPPILSSSSEQAVKMAPLDYLCLPWRFFLACRNAKIITVEPAIFLLMFARELYKPLYEQYYYVDYGLRTLVNTSFPFPNGSFCLNSTEIDKYAGNGTYKTVEAYSNHLLMYGQIANRLPSMVVTLLLGPLSDRFGRRFIIIAPALGAILQSALSLTIVHFQWSPYYFILANFLSGITGGFVGVLAGGFSYVADVSSPKWRGFRIGVIEAVLGIAGALGQFVTGYWLLLINCDFIPPLWLTLSCNAGAVAYVLLLVPESLTESEREEMAIKNPKGCKNIAKTFKIFLGKAQYRTTWKLWVSTLFIGTVVFSFGGYKLISVYFLKALPFDFDPLMIGYYQSAQSVSRAICNVVILPILLALRMSDAAVALVGLVTNCLCNLLTGFAEKTYQVFTSKSLIFMLYSIMHAIIILQVSMYTMFNYM